MEEEKFKELLSAFALDGEPISIERFGEGHINETYLVKTAADGGNKKYIFQKINSGLFPDAEKLMHNIKLVTEFNRKKIEERGGNPDRESLTLVYTKDGEPYLKSPCGNYRIYKYIDGVAYQVVEKPEHFYQSAVAFGNFANLLAEFDAKSLYEVLPDFHNTVKRFKDFKNSLEKNASGRADDVKEEIEFVLSREEYCNRITSLLASGEMPTKVTHNDTKLNNVMFDKNTGKYLAVIDLDTIMPGSICYDFGDSIRFGCNPSTEDERDLSKVNFDINLFEQYAKGYLSALGNGATQTEKDNLAFSSVLMTYECGMRFLADHIDGDKYFRITRENQNLDRARTQFKLIRDMEKLLPEMQAIVKKY